MLGSIVLGSSSNACSDGNLATEFILWEQDTSDVLNGFSDLLCFKRTIIKLTALSQYSSFPSATENLMSCVR